MAWFEVFIPSRETGFPNITLTVQSPNWVGALKTGLSNLGDEDVLGQNIACDIQEDGSIHVTDAATQRVFRMREIAGPRTVKSLVPPPAAPSSTPAPLDATPAAPAALPRRPTLPEPIALPDTPPLGAPPPRPAPVVAPPRSMLDAPTSDATIPNEAPAPQALVAPAATTAVHPPLPPVVAPAGLSSTMPTETAMPRVPTPRPARTIETPVAPPPAVATSTTTPAKAKKSEPKPEAKSEPKPEPRPEPKAPVVESKPMSAEAAAQARIADAVADVFEATQELMLEPVFEEVQVAERMLDLALEKIPAESGTFYLANLNDDELRFAAVRGPKADEIRKAKPTVKLGQGIVGFAAQEGLCLFVGDLERDPRFASGIAKSLGHKAKDTLCAAVEKDGRLYGAVQLLNSKAGFDAAHVEVLRYIGAAAAAMLERAFDARR